MSEEQAVKLLNKIKDRSMLTEIEVDLSNLCIKNKNIIKNIYKKLREFDVCGNMGVSMQISYLIEYLESEFNWLEDKYLNSLRGEDDE